MPKNRARLVVVFRAAGRVRTVVANPKAKANRDLIVSESEADALGLLACDPGTPRAAPLDAPLERIGRKVDRVIRVWCTPEAVADAERIAAVYLVHGDPDEPVRIL